MKIVEATGFKQAQLGRSSQFQLELKLTRRLYIVELGEQTKLTWFVNVISIDTE